MNSKKERPTRILFGRQINVLEQPLHLCMWIPGLYAHFGSLHSSHRVCSLVGLSHILECDQHDTPLTVQTVVRDVLEVQAVNLQAALFQPIHHSTN